MPKRRLPDAVVDSDEEEHVDGDGQVGKAASAEEEGKIQKYDDAILFQRRKFAEIACQLWDAVDATGTVRQRVMSSTYSHDDRVFQRTLESKLRGVAYNIFGEEDKFHGIVEKFREMQSKLTHNVALDQQNAIGEVVWKIQELEGCGAFFFPY